MSGYVLHMSPPSVVFNNLDAFKSPPLTQLDVSSSFSIIINMNVETSSSNIANQHVTEMYSKEYNKL